MSERKISFKTNNTYSNPKRSRIQKTTRGYVTKLNRDIEKQYQTRRVKLVERDRKKVLISSVKPNKEKNKFNFLYWVTCIVLVLILGSFAITGYVNSKITENQTQETITHTYYYDEYVEPTAERLYNGSKIYYNKFLFNYFFSSLDSMYYIDWATYYRNYYSASLYSDVNYMFGHYDYFVESYNGLELRYFVIGFSNDLPLLYGVIDIDSDNDYDVFLLADSDVNVYLLIPFSEIGFNLAYNVYYIVGSPRILFDSDYNGLVIDYSSNAFYFDNSYFEFSDSTLSILLYPYFASTEFTNVITHEKTYSYHVKDINYNWQNKFSQLGYLKNIFNGNDKFYDESYNYYSSKKSLILPFTNNNNYIQEQIEEYYLTDEKVKLLYDYGILTFASKTKKIVSGGNPFKNEYYYYIVLNDDIVLGDENVSSAINYINENYITSFNIDYYLEIQPDDFSLLSIFAFPIQVIYRIMYNFGVIVNFIISW